MQPTVQPIAWTQIDWRSFLSLASKTVGPLTAGLDKAKMPPDNAAAFIASLAVLENEQNDDAVKAIRQPGGLLRHISFSFFIVMDEPTLYELLQLTRLAVTSSETRVRNVYAAVVSGNLEEWRTTIINVCTDRVSYELRMLIDKCIMCFTQAGLAPTWYDYQKVQQKDGTFAMVKK